MRSFLQYRVFVQLSLSALLVANLSVSALAQSGPTTLYVEPTESGFHTFVIAAVHKKQVPITVVSAPENASYRMTLGEVEVEHVGTGKRLINCLFAYCAGIEDKASTSVTLTDSAGTIVWSYAVNKGRGAKNRQSMAEAIAKHLKNDYFGRSR